jgi:hypothetical protein
MAKLPRLRGRGFFFRRRRRRAKLAGRWRGWSLPSPEYLFAGGDGGGFPLLGRPFFLTGARPRRLAPPTPGGVILILARAGTSPLRAACTPGNSHLPRWDFQPRCLPGLFSCGHVGVAGADPLRYTRAGRLIMIEFIVIVVLLVLLIGIFVRGEVFK